MRKIIFWVLILLMVQMPARGQENEILQDSGAKVYVREHPQTGKPFVSLRAGEPAQDPFKGFTKREIRPDYKMLEADSKGVPYDGPVSDLKKVYVFAATMMTLGVAGVVVTAALPVAAAAGASTTGTGVLAGGAVVATGVAADLVVESQIKPGEEHYIHEGKAVSAEADPKKISFQEALLEIDSKKSPGGI
jgi:hypothetical protein